MEVVETELNEVKSQILVAEFNRDAQIQQQDRKAQEEIASLQQLVHGLLFGFFLCVCKNNDLISYF